MTLPAAEVVVMPPHTNRLLIAAILITVGTGCASTQPFTVVPDRSVLLNEEQAEAAVQQCSRAAPTIEGGWTPTPQDVAQLEADLEQVHRLESDECCFGGMEVDDVNAFFRQYVGVVSGGRPMIYVNAFPVTEFENWPSDLVALPDWTAEPFIVCDGGSSYWGALYDPERRLFSMLAFNGVAL
ncbi:hypothetical protein [Rubrivirga sp. IMCC45206]|uniref:hypothetical protein n=1 Tax=Rubrivirga sp. IMCC45206 TaxID=3391614 RepID=UPI00398F9D94